MREQLAPLRLSAEGSRPSWQERATSARRRSGPGTGIQRRRPPAPPPLAFFEFSRIRQPPRRWTSPRPGLRSQGAPAAPIQEPVRVQGRGRPEPPPPPPPPRAAGSSQSPCDFPPAAAGAPAGRRGHHRGRRGQGGRRFSRFPRLCPRACRGMAPGPATESQSRSQLVLFVVTPHHSQKAVVMAALVGAEGLFRLGQVSTLEGWEGPIDLCSGHGREEDASGTWSATTPSNSNLPGSAWRPSAGFLLSLQQRLNVAVTRARRLCVVLLSEGLLELGLMGGRDPEGEAVKVPQLRYRWHSCRRRSGEPH